MSANAHQTFIARLVACRVIKHAGSIPAPNLQGMWCPDCHRYPVIPVTGQCGHTRCTKCILKKWRCPCGVMAPSRLRVNIFVQNLIRKILRNRHILHGNPPLTTAQMHVQGDAANGPSRQERVENIDYSEPSGSQAISDSSEVLHYPYWHSMSPRIRYEHAKDLLALGKHMEAAVELACVASSSRIISRVAKKTLIEIIMLLLKKTDPDKLTANLCRCIRERASTLPIQTSDLECVICYETLEMPITTPCGHTFCRVCLKRTLKNARRCPLCAQSLEHFNLRLTKDTSFLSAVLEAVVLDHPVLVPVKEHGQIPIFVCTIAYPTLACPLFIVGSRFWDMLKQVLKSGTRKFGMVPMDPDGTYSNYGTVLEVKDFVQFEDGRSIVSTVGLSRFRVIDKVMQNGTVSQIETIKDIKPTARMAIWKLQAIAKKIDIKAKFWLSTVETDKMNDIENSLGKMPPFPEEDGWWDTPDGPAWLWWITSILPLRHELKVLLLSSTQLLKRMQTVSRTFEMMEYTHYPELSLTDTDSDYEYDENDYDEDDEDDEDEPYEMEPVDEEPYEPLNRAPQHVGYDHENQENIEP